MAFNWPVFRTRALTAIVFVAVMLVGLLWGYWSFFLLFTVIHFGCWWEYFKLMEKRYDVDYNDNLKMGLMVFGFGVMLYVPILGEQLVHARTSSFWITIGGFKIDINFLVLAVGTLWTLGGTVLQKQLSLKPFGMAALGILYISVSWGLLLGLRNFFYELSVYSANGFDPERLGSENLAKLVLYETKAFWICLIVVVTMWINDTMAYIVGSLIGKTPLSKISPKKTWEGTIGGILLSSIILGLVSYFLLQPIFVKEHSVLFWILFILVVAIAGTFGDLLESKLKRMAGIKDSGSIMPGHGGFLDRFDSLLLATPFAWIYVVIFMR